VSTENDRDNGAADSEPSPEEEGAGASSAPDASASPAEVDPVAVAQAEAARYKDQLLRTAADYDNFRKRARRETQDAERRGSEDMLKTLLPVFDNLERAVAHAESATEVKALADGVALVVRQFVDLLSKIGIERVPTVGTPFDPTVHEAVQHVETGDYPPGSVAIEVQPGYRMGDRLIRPAMVCVAKQPANQPVPPPDGAAGEAP
jgi:molecular chaperone GrpE